MRRRADAGGRRAGAGRRRPCGKLLPDVPDDARPTSSGCRCGDRAAAFAAACEDAGVIVRPFAGDGVRVTIGTPEENDAFLDCL